MIHHTNEFDNKNHCTAALQKTLTETFQFHLALLLSHLFAKEIPEGKFYQDHARLTRHSSAFATRMLRNGFCEACHYAVISRIALFHQVLRLRFTPLRMTALI